jgi:hypothetical protein
MSILTDIKNIYSNIPKSEPPKQIVTPLSPELLDKTMEHLNKQPIVAPNITRK